jgi:hypothetical protein
MTPRLTLLALAGAGLALVGCGRTGELQRPAPMFGAPAPASASTQSSMTAEQRARMDAQRSGDDPETPQSVQDLRRMQGGDINPARSEPIPGANPDPNGAQPPGALPDPYNYPNESPG